MKTFATVLALLVCFAFGGCFRRQLSFRFVLEPGFQGRLYAVEDPGLPLEYGRIYDLRPNGDVVKVPKGFCASDVPDMPDWRVVDVRDSSGAVLSVGENAPNGVIGYRGFMLRRDAKPGQSHYFLFMDSNRPDWDR